MKFHTVEDMFDFLQRLEERGVITIPNEDQLTDELDGAFEGEGDYDIYQEDEEV